MLRHGARPLIAVVRQRKGGGWVLPKGKLKPHEGAKSAARREAVEETGQKVLVHEFLGAISHEAGGKPKITQFWRMQTRDGEAHELAKDITAVEWLSLSDALKRLTNPIERTFLGEIGRHALLAARARRHHPRKPTRHKSRNKIVLKRVAPPKSETPHQAAAEPRGLLRRIMRGLRTP